LSFKVTYGVYKYGIAIIGGKNGNLVRVRNEKIDKYYKGIEGNVLKIKFIDSNNFALITSKGEFAIFNINKNFPIKVTDVVLQGRIGVSKKFWGFSKEDIFIAKESLEKVGAYNLKDKRIGELSGGQRQRVFIARALSTKADILLLDEPTASIDSKGQISLYAMLKELNENKGIIVVSHNINVATGFANKVAYTNKTLYMHNSPAVNKDKILQNIGNSTEHICPVELMLNENMCLHSQDMDTK